MKLLSALALHLVSSSFLSNKATCGWVPAEVRARTEASDVICPGARHLQVSGNASACPKSTSPDGEGTFNCDTPQDCELRCSLCAVELAKEGLRGCNAFDFQPLDGPNDEACWFRHVSAWDLEQVAGHLQDARNESINTEYQLLISCNDCSKDPSQIGCGDIYATSHEDGASSSAAYNFYDFIVFAIGCTMFVCILCVFLKNTFDVHFNYT
jgi:hypothetical protein